MSPVKSWKRAFGLTNWPSCMRSWVILNVITLTNSLFGLRTTFTRLFESRATLKLFNVTSASIYRSVRLGPAWVVPARVFARLSVSQNLIRFVRRQKYESNIKWIHYNATFPVASQGLPKLLNLINFKYRKQLVGAERKCVEFWGKPYSRQWIVRSRLLI